ncbi:MAG: PulJ/GspJ family protein [Planctomycetota bacterium]
MNKTCKISGSRRGFSLGEVLAAMLIGAMVLVAVLSIYGRVENAAAGITRKLDSSKLPFEVLQRIAEDLDRIVAGNSDTKVTIENGYSESYATAKLTILKTYKDSGDKPQTFEEIIWIASYDYESDANGLVLYRSYSGIVSEDKLLDEQRASWEKDYPLVPICEGVTFFKIQIPKGDQLMERWASDSLPRGIVAIISFAEPFEGWDGTLDVPETEKITRTIAIDRTRSIRFTIVPVETEEEDEEGGEDLFDANDANDVEDVND